MTYDYDLLDEADEIVAVPANGPTDKQVAYIQSLRIARQYDVDVDYSLLTKGTASLLIDALLKLPRRSNAPAPTATKTEPYRTPDEGLYWLKGQVVKVQVAKNGSGNHYAKRLVNGSFEYAAGLIRNMSEATRMTPELAKQFGDLYGVCCNCGADLTDETSIERGVGPVCYKRLFGAGK